MDTAPKRLTALEMMEAARRFVDLLRDVEYVDTIILENEEREAPELWTVLSSPAFEEGYRDPVYEAQGQVIDELSEPVFDFRVVNVNDHGGRLEHVLPAHGRVLYQRHAGG